MSRPFLIALQFLTRLPIRLSDVPDDAAIGRSVLYYPLVGLLIGLLLTGLATLFAWHAPPLLAAALLLVSWILVSGALHLDGLADSADAWIGGHGDRERTMAIMKDPYCGPVGVAAVVSVLLVKFGAIAALAGTANHAGILLAPLLGRAALPLLFLTTPYVRPNGLGAAMSARLPRKGALAVVVGIAIAIAIAFGARGLRPVAAALAIFFLLRRAMLGRIGGMTGDTAGAMVELIEAAAIAAAAM